MVGGILYSLKVAVKERWKNISLNCGKRWFYCFFVTSKVSRNKGINVFVLSCSKGKLPVKLFFTYYSLFIFIFHLFSMYSFRNVQSFFKILFLVISMVPLFLQQSLRFLVMPLSMSLRSILSDIFIIFWLLKAFSVGIVALLSGFV